MLKKLKLTKFILAASPVLLFSNTTVANALRPSNSIVLAQKDEHLSKLPEWKKTMRNLVIKFSNAHTYPKYDSLSAKVKDELFDVQDHIFQQLGYNPYFKFFYTAPSSDNRYFNEWWGANLWLNLTVSETNWWINRLKSKYPIGPQVSSGLKYTAIASAVAGVVQPEFSFVFKLISILAKVGVFVNYYFNWSYLSKIAQEGHGAISFRFLFGFIPAGIMPAYKVVQS